MFKFKTNVNRLTDENYCHHTMSYLHAQTNIVSWMLFIGICVEIYSSLWTLRVFVRALISYNEKSLSCDFIQFQPHKSKYQFETSQWCPLCRSFGSQSHQKSLQKLYALLNPVSKQHAKTRIIKKTSEVCQDILGSGP